MPRCIALWCAAAMLGALPGLSGFEAVAETAPTRAPLPKVIERTTAQEPGASGPRRILAPGKAAPKISPLPPSRGREGASVRAAALPPGSPPVADPALGVPLPPERPVLRGASLIGIFAFTTGRSALVMSPNGTVRQMTVGDTMDGWKISAITRTEMRMTRGNQTRTFVLVGN